MNAVPAIDVKTSLILCSMNETHAIYRKIKTKNKHIHKDTHVTTISTIYSSPILWLDYILIVTFMILCNNQMSVNLK